jgi:hypothetical protein
MVCVGGRLNRDCGSCSRTALGQEREIYTRYEPIYYCDLGWPVHLKKDIMFFAITLFETTSCFQNDDWTSQQQPNTQNDPLLEPPNNGSALYVPESRSAVSH